MPLQVMARSETLENLQIRSQQLAVDSKQFEENSKRLKKKLCWQNYKIWLVLAALLVLVLVIIFLSVCLGGPACFH